MSSAKSLSGLTCTNPPWSRRTDHPIRRRKTVAETRDDEKGSVTPARCARRSEHGSGPGGPANEPTACFPTTCRGKSAAYNLTLRMSDCKAAHEQVPNRGRSEGNGRVVRSSPSRSSPAQSSPRIGSRDWSSGEPSPRKTRRIRSWSSAAKRHGNRVMCPSSPGGRLASWRGEFESDRELYRNGRAPRHPP